MMVEFPIYLADYEVRQVGISVRIAGRFEYNQDAIISNRGNERKERISPGAFDFAIDEGREVNLLAGHDFNRPMATTRNGSLLIRSTREALEFLAALPKVESQPTYMRDTLEQIRAGLTGGISPGFTTAGIPGATESMPEPGNPNVSIRVIRAALLYELSIVTRPAYPNTLVAEVNAPPPVDLSPDTFPEDLFPEDLVPEDKFPRVPNELLDERMTAQERPGNARPARPAVRRWLL